MFMYPTQCLIMYYLLYLFNNLGDQDSYICEKDLVLRYANRIIENEWKFIETFSLTHFSGQFRPTSHFYKLNFINGTNFLRSENVSDSQFLSLAKFDSILKNRVISEISTNKLMRKNIYWQFWRTSVQATSINTRAMGICLRVSSTIDFEITDV